MKKHILFIILLYFLFSSKVYAASFKWTSVGINEGDTEWFYDRKTVFKVGDYRYYWILANYLKNIEDDIFSVIGHHMVNCTTQETKWITYTSYNSPMGRGEMIDSWIIPEIDLEYFQWEYWDYETSIYGQLIKEVCEE